MAARTRRRFHDEATRERIQSAQIINRLQAFILGEKGPQGEKVWLEPHQVTGALGLLKKVIPDLAATEHSGDLNFHNDISDKPLTPEQWAEAYTTH